MEEINTHVGYKISKRRKQLNLSQIELGEILGVSGQQIHKYESGVNKISAGMLFTCAKVFKVPITYFYEGINLRNKQPANSCNSLCCDRKTPLFILLVEDNPIDEMLFRTALTKCDKETSLYTVYNGVDALQVLRGNKTPELTTRPDIIFLDLNIPKRCGLDVLKEIKQDRVVMDIPVVVLTNSINPDDMTKSYKSGASGFMSKSFDVKEFNEKISSVINCWAKAMVLPSMQDVMPMLKEA